MSVPATAELICRWTGGNLLRGEREQSFASTLIDSREAGPGDLFVAIVGPNHDAHRFVSDVLSKGVAGVLIQSDRPSDPEMSGTGFVIQVADTTVGLGDLARGHRDAFNGPLIGITGSNGKTTTKELCAGILEGVGPTLATRGNLNNNFGVPLTLLRRCEADRYAVVEMGMNHRGEIATLAAIAQPTIGILTNVGSAHIEFLGSREAIAEEKGDLLACLPAQGTAVVCHDQPLAFAQSKRTKASVLSFGREPGADLLARAIRATDDGAFAFTLETPFGRGEIRVAGLSQTIVENALAAAGGALAAGASFEAVATGLENHSGVPGRMQPHPLPDGVLLIDDSYNANPQSMQSALETLAALETRGQRIAVLGQMGELGDEGEAAHREAGRLAGALGLDQLFLTGPMAEVVATGARDGGLDSARVHIGSDHAELASLLRDHVKQGDRILVKGSRAAQMERVIEAFEKGRH
jgi:UDP-N-acetylmuramoyl-tripeptide--D-alanyl-D-alanine ligase